MSKKQPTRTMNRIISSIILISTMALVCVAHETMPKHVRGRLYNLEAPTKDLTIDQLKDKVLDFLSKHRTDTDLVGDEVAKLLPKTSDKQARLSILKGYTVQEFIEKNSWNLASACDKKVFERRSKMCNQFKHNNKPILPDNCLSHEEHEIKTDVNFQRSLGAYCWNVYKEMQLQCKTFELEKKIKALDYDYGETMAAYFSEEADKDKMDQESEVEPREICKLVLKELPKPSKLNDRDWGMREDSYAPNRAKWLEYYNKCKLLKSKKYNINWNRILSPEVNKVMKKDVQVQPTQTP